MSRKKYVPPSKLAARVYKALLLTNFVVIPEAQMSNTRLRFDFAVPNLNLFVECQGSQHEVFNSHHYASKDDFRAAKARDQKKAAYCEENAQTLVTLSEKEIMGAASPEALLQTILKLASQQQSESEEEW